MRVNVLRRIMLHLGITVCMVSTSGIMPVSAQIGNLSRSEFPGRRIGGGTRSECLAGNQPIAALNPANNLGVTASNRPSVYFVVPRLDESYPVEFLLRDAEGNAVYETTLKAGKQAITGVHLPPNTVKVGQDYQWYFSVVCDREDRSQNIVLSGWMRRVASDLSDGLSPEVQLSLKAKLNLAQSYQNAGLWSDAISTLVELNQAYPDSEAVRLAWQKLIQKLDLEWVFQQSLAGHL
ncbi:DUF928 domain-containing protein [Leptothermofonsia sichuanensis E412]|uniref:DUF928 domain-containing protein n=1 Tax=Leptothermofonsia sichuanensis TaxID=2917832 RepID=UPI001CA60915|nr:DUF928 domain-containing protein [Leptothermofonsia sichuanensis]QZZ22396.1 DUF928 domain-containing protein [Leptothermofonsia sichuanensis E412]